MKGGNKDCTLTTMLGVLLIAFFTGRTFQNVLFFGFGAIATILATPVIRKRSKVLLPSLIVEYPWQKTEEKVSAGQPNH